MPDVVPLGPKPRPGARSHQRPGLRLAEPAETEAGVPASWAQLQGPMAVEEGRRQQADTTAQDPQRPVLR